jgi:YfiH family protein
MDEAITPPTTSSSRAMFERSRLLPEWSAPSCVHAFTTLRGPAGASIPPFDSFNLGIRCGDDAAVVARNRDALVKHLHVPSRPRWLRQVHGTTVATCDDDACIDEPEADAAVTSSPGVALAILTADCLPVLFCSGDGETIGAAHAGWRGLSAGVLENTIASMRTPPGRMLAWLGPAAGPNAYEIGEEVRDAFVLRDRRAEPMFVPTRPDHWLVDLHGLAILRLLDVGMPRMAIHGGDLCTISDPRRFFSYRRDGRTGRMASLIWINRASARA